MKKYIIKDNLGNKKTVYADNLRHALTFVDSTKNDVNRPKIFKFFINNRAVSEDEYTKSFIKEAAREHQSATTAKRVINEDKESAKISGKSVFMCESGSKFSIIYDSIKNEASLATSINALITDEKAAIDSYNVAIKNLEGKIDDIAMQVLINIMKDERRHVENLYAILNNQVTEKNLKDSKLKDSKFYVGISADDYTEEQAEKDARKFGLQLKIVGKSSDPHFEYDAYLIGPRSNILKMLKANDMEDFEEDIED